MGNEQAQPIDAFNAREVKTVDWEIKHKLARGTNYNMKVVIRGDRNTGKTQLWRRLQGQTFTASYAPTSEIQVSTINWNYKATDDLVKVECWDVVDKGKKKKSTGSAGLKLENEGDDANAEEDDDDDEASQTEPASSEQDVVKRAISKSAESGPGSRSDLGKFSVATADASTVNVMRGTNGVVLMFDITKRWTWDYVTREVAKVPEGIFILVCGNFRDMGANRVVSELEAEEFCKRQAGGRVKYLEASMKNAYGVRNIVSFFNLPFLDIQRRSILAQLERNAQEVAMVEQELKMMTEELSYEAYLKSLAEKKNAIKRVDSAPVVPAPAAVPAASHQPLPSSSLKQTTSAAAPVAVAPVVAPTVEPPKAVAAAPAQKPHKETPVVILAPEISPEDEEPIPAAPKPAPVPQPKPVEVTPKKPEPAKPVVSTQPAPAKVEPTKAPAPVTPVAAAPPAQKPLKIAEEPKPKPKEQPKTSPAPKKDAKKDPKKEDPKSAIEALKSLASKKGEAGQLQDVDAFVPDDVDDAFLGGADDDGWLKGGDAGFGDDEEQGNPMLLTEEEPEDTK